MRHTAPPSGETMACACAALHRNGKFLFGRRSPGKRFYPNGWDLLGGHVRVGETIEAALVREIEEEVGVIPANYRQRLTRLLLQRSMHGKCSFRAKGDLAAR